MKNSRQKNSRRSLSLRVTSLFLIVCLSAANTASYAEPLQTPPVLKISGKYGTLDESFSAGSGKTVIYIQDAHDSLEAQENIAKIIGELVKKSGVKTVFEEGYEGPVPTDKFFGVIKDAKIRERVSYFLLDHLRIGGAEYAHINRCKSAKKRGETAEKCSGDFRLIGADSVKLHLENVAWYHKSAKHRRQIETDLNLIFKEIESLANQYFPKELKSWIKNKERFEKQEMGILDYLKRLQVTSNKSQVKTQASLPNITLLLEMENSKNPADVKKLKGIDTKALFQEIDRMEENLAEIFLRNDRDRQIFHYHKTLSLLKRLNRIEVTQAEYEALKESLRSVTTEGLARFIAKESRKSLALSKRWEAGIKNAVRFYEIAHARDRAIETRLDEFLKSPDEKVAALVFGGFHKEAIKEIFYKKNISYHIVSPKISETDTKHRDYYRRLMSRGYEPFQTPALLSQASRYPPVFVEAASTQGADQAIRQILTLAEEIRNPAGRSELRNTEFSKSDRENLLTVIQNSYWQPLSTQRSFRGKQHRTEGKTILDVYMNDSLPFVLKVPHEHVPLSEFTYAKKMMGGLMAPFTILENVTISGKTYPFVLAQKKLEVIDETDWLPKIHTLQNGRTVSNLHEQERELLVETVRRGILLLDTQRAKNYGIDPETGKLYFVDHMDAEHGTFDRAFPLKQEGSPRMENTAEEKQFPREFYRGRIWHLDRAGMPSDSELSSLWNTNPGIYPVDDVSLPNRSELRSFDGTGALKIDPKTSGLQIPSEERENLKLAAINLVQKIHADPRNLREVIVVPGSGFWAAETVKRVWAQNYPNEELNFHDMNSADFESRLETLSKTDSPLLVLDDSALTMRAATAVRKILETKIAPERLIFSVLYAGDYAADPEGFYPAGDPMGPAAKQAYPYLYDGRFLFGLKNQRALEQGFPIWHLVRRFAKSGSVSDNPQSIAAQLPELAQNVLAAREEILKNFRAAGGDPEILNFDERWALNDRLEKAGTTEADRYLKTYLPGLLDGILKEPARSELRNLSPEAAKALPEIVRTLNRDWAGESANTQANLVLLADTVEELPRLTHALMALEASIESPSVKDTAIYQKLLHNDLAAVNRAIEPANYVILYNPDQTQAPFSLAPLPLQKIVSALNRGWAGEANQIQGELIRLAEELPESDKLEPWLMGVITSVQELSSGRLAGDSNISDARLRALITGSLQSDLREANNILIPYQLIITFDPSALKRPFALVSDPKIFSSDEKNPSAQRSELRSPKEPENSDSPENVLRRVLERYTELLNEAAALAAAQSDQTFHFERIRERFSDYLRRLGEVFVSGDSEVIRQLALNENSVLEREARTLESLREGALSDSEYENLKSYLAQDPETRVAANPLSLAIKDSVRSGFDDFVRRIGNLKMAARKNGLRTGVINIMLHEATRQEEDLRDKITEYYTLLRREKSRAGKNFSPEKSEALNTIRWMGIGDIITASPESRIAKAGGLADVMRELPEGLSKSGASITVVSFLYEKEQSGRPGENGRHKSADVIIQEEGLKKEAYQLKIHIGPTKHSGSDAIKDPARDILADVYTKSTGDLHEVFLSIPGKTEVLYPGNLSASELLDLALLLSRGTLEYARAEGIYPHAILTNDWMASLIPLYLRVDAFDTSYKKDPHFRQTRGVAVGHNLGRAYQLNLSTNEFVTDIFPKLEISGEHYSGISDEPIDNTHMNLVKANFFHADDIVVVSPKYLLENLEDESISKLEWLLRERAENAYGISNGIDDGKWREDYDKLGRELAGMPPGAGPPSQESYTANLSRYKSAAKLHIQKKYAAAGPSEKFFGSLVIDKNKTLIGLAARLAEQKGIELFVEGARQILDSDPTVQIVIAGSVPKTGSQEPEAVFERAMIELAQNEQYKGRFVFHPEFIEPKLLFLGIDFFMMPSKDEPGGIAQLQALLAGAGVIGRATGGIANSVRQFNPNTRQGDGFLFDAFETQAFVNTVSQALTAFRDKKNRDAIRDNAATADNSWEKSSRFYLSFFQNAAGVLKDDYPHLKSARERLRAIQPHLDHPKASTGLRSELRSEIVRFKDKKLMNIPVDLSQMHYYENDFKLILQFLRSLPGLERKVLDQILEQTSDRNSPIRVEQYYEDPRSGAILTASIPFNIESLFHENFFPSLSLFKLALMEAASSGAMAPNGNLITPRDRLFKRFYLTLSRERDAEHGEYIKIFIQGASRSELRTNQLFGHKLGDESKKRFSIEEIIDTELGIAKNERAVTPIEILDVGAGSGIFQYRLLGYLKDRKSPDEPGYEKATITGIDNQKPEVNLAQANGYDVRFADIANSESLRAAGLKPGSFKMITLMAPEAATIPDFDQWLQNIDSLLADDGILLIRLFEFSVDEDSDEHKEYLEKESLKLKEALDAAIYFTYHEFTEHTTPDLPIGTHQLGPVILVKKNKTGFRGNYNENRSELRNQTLLAHDARKWAKILEDADPLKVFGDALSREQKLAQFQLHNYDIDKLLNDFLALPEGSREYQLTVTALSYTMNLLAFKKIRELAMSLDPAADARRLKDLTGALRQIQYEVFMNIEGGDRDGKTTNRRTWEGRTTLSYPLIDQEVNRYERLNQNMVIGDFAVSDGTSAYELAKRYQNRGIRVKIAAYDKVFGFYLFPYEGVTYAFDNTGKFTEAIFGSQLFFDDTIPPAAAREAFDRLSEEQKNNFYVSLINPEAEIFSKQYPDLLEFKQHDVFKPLPAEHDFIRVSGLLMRGQHRYFSEDQIQTALGFLGASLKEGGRLLNGTFWGSENSPTGQYDLFKRQGDQLVLENVHPPSTSRTGWESVNLNPSLRSELRLVTARDVASIAGHLGIFDTAVIDRLKERTKTEPNLQIKVPIEIEDNDWLNQDYQETPADIERVIARGTPRKVVTGIQAFLRSQNEIPFFVLAGSTLTGKPGSDIDLVMSSDIYYRNFMAFDDRSESLVTSLNEHLRPSGRSLEHEPMRTMMNIENTVEKYGYAVRIMPDEIFIITKRSELRNRSDAQLRPRIERLVKNATNLKSKIHEKLLESEESDILITQEVVKAFGEKMEKLRERKNQILNHMSTSQQKRLHMIQLSNLLDEAAEELAQLQRVSVPNFNRKRSELRKTAAPQLQKNSKGTLLMDADDIAALTPQQRDELFSTLYTNRTNLRLVVYNEHGQLDTDKSLKAISKLSNTFVSSGKAAEALKRYGIPKSMVVSISNQENAAKAQSALGAKLREKMKFVRLRKEVGKIILAELLARNGALWNDLVEKDGFVEPRTESVLAAINRQRLAHMVIAYAA